MKVAFFTDTYEPQINGVVTAIRLFSKYLRLRGHEVHIFYPSADKKPSDSRKHKFPSVGFRNYPGYRIAIPYALMFEKEFMGMDFDVVHVHTPAVTGIAGLLLAKLYHKPVVGTFHTLIPEYSHYFLGSLQNIRPFKRLAKMLLWKYTAMFYNECDVVIAPTEEMKKLLIRHGVRKGIKVIPAGIEMIRSKKSKAALRKKHGFSIKDKLILHVGRVTKEKNIRLILNAMKRLDGAKLIIASDGPYRNVLENAARKMGISERVIFTGFVSEGILNEFYRMSDVFVMASKTETQGLVLAEAAVHGLPIVVLDAPVISDFVMENDAGIVSDERGFAKNVRLVLKNEKLRKRFADNSAIKNYDIRKCTREMADIYSHAKK